MRFLHVTKKRTCGQNFQPLMLMLTMYLMIQSNKVTFGVSICLEYAAQSQAVHKDKECPKSKIAKLVDYLIASVDEDSRSYI